MKNKIRNRSRIWIAVLTAILMILGCTSKDQNMPVTTTSKKAKSLFLEARIQMFDGNSKKSTELLKQALELDKDFALANLYYGYSGIGSINREKYLNAAYEKRDDVSEAEKHLILAFIAYSKGNRTEVITEMKAAIESSPQDKYLLMNMANVYDSYMQYDNALEYAKKGYEIDTLFANGVNYQGYLLWRLKKIADAERMYKKSLEMSPNNASFYNNYGQLLRDEGRIDEAIAMHRKALEIKQDYLSFLFLGHCYVASNDYQKARENYLKAFDASDNNGQKNFCLESVGQTHLYEGKLPEALMAFDKRAEFNRQIGKMDVEILNSISFKVASCLIYNDIENSTKFIREIKDLIPSLELTETDQSDWNKYLILMEGQLNAYSGNTVEAVKYLDQFEKSLDENEKENYKNEILELKGIIELKKGNYNEAITILEKSNVYAAICQYYAGIAYEKTGNTEKAKEIFSSIWNNNLTSFQLAVVKPFARKKLTSLTE